VSDEHVNFPANGSAGEKFHISGSVSLAPKPIDVEASRHIEPLRSQFLKAYDAVYHKNINEIVDYIFKRT
jgi:hypothetical protein